MTVVDPNVGFIRPTLAEITSAIQQDYWSNIDPGLDLSPEGPYGQAISLQADREDSLWELLEFLYHSSDPRSAKGFALDGICLFLGIFRQPASAGVVDITLTGTRPVDIPTTFTVRDPGNALSRWRLSAAQSLTGTGAFTETFAFTCENVGNIPALAGTLTDIVTPIAGVDTATNALAVTPGREQETDGELRARRDNSLVATGGYPADAIRAAVLNVVGVTECKVLENPTGSFDANGLPPYAIEVIVDGVSYDQDQVAAAIWAHRAAGTPLYNNPLNYSTGYVTDAEGVQHQVNFSLATVVEMLINVTVETDPTTYPVDGDTRVANVLAGFSPGYRLGADVVRLKLMAAVLDVQGVLDVTVLELKASADPSYISTNYPIGLRERAHIDASNVAVTVLP